VSDANGFVDTVPPAALAAIVPLPIYLSPRASGPLVAVRPGRGPPGPELPLFIAHCAFLS
jgi:hypothetical protein